MKRTKFFSARYSNFRNRHELEPVWNARKEWPCLPEIAGHDSFDSTEFWQWLKNNKDLAFGTFPEALARFGQKYGFYIHAHYLHTKQVERYKMVHEHFGWLEYHGKK